MPGNRLPPGHQEVVSAAPYNVLEMNGDEQTWALEDWAWDPHALAARRLPAQGMAHGCGSACQVPCQTHADPHACCQLGGSTASAGGSGACSFRMPPAALAGQSMKRAASQAGPGYKTGPSPFAWHSAAELNIATPGPAGPGYGGEASPARADSEDRCDCEGAAACCGRGGGGGGEPSAKRTKQEDRDSQEALDAAIADGAIVLCGKPACSESDRMVCQVAGCGKDLSALKDYHQRYHVCEKHIKLPAIVKDGRLQRFCQQCGRFHPLAAFDGARKSCREQLNKHNARRRRRAQIEQLKARATTEAGQAAVQAALADATDTARASEGGGGHTDAMHMHMLQQQQQQGDGAASLAAAAAAAAAALPMGALVGGGFADVSSAAAAAGLAGGGAPDVSRLLFGLMQSPQQLQALRLLLGVPSNSALPPLKPYEPFDCPVCEPGKACCDEPGGDDPAGYALARSISQGRGEHAPEYCSEHRVLRISMKLFNRTPADLPPDLRDQVTSWLAAAPAHMEGYIRPGCVYLTLQMLVEQSVYADAVERGLHGLLSHLLHVTGCAFWWTGSYTVQLMGDLAAVDAGQVHLVSAAASAAAAVPRLSQLVVVAGSGSDGLATAAATTRVSFSWAPAAPQQKKQRAPAEQQRQQQRQQQQAADPYATELYMRYRGVQSRVALERIGRGNGGAAAAAPSSAAVAHLPLGAGSSDGGGCGVAMLEVVQGAYAWSVRPLLVVDDAGLAAEVAQLASVTTPATCAARAAREAAEAAEGGEGPCANFPGWQLTPDQVDAVLVDLGLVLAHIGSCGSCGSGSGSGSGSAGPDAPAPHGHPRLPHACLTLKARRLLAFACDMGWACVAQRVLPIAMAPCGGASATVDAVHAATTPSPARTLPSLVWAPASNSNSSPSAPHQSVGSSGAGLSLLHRAVRSGSLSLVSGMLHWGLERGYAWRGDTAGPGGLTPLHLAALVEDARIAVLLLDHCPPGALTRLATASGVTPFHLAFQMGHWDVPALLRSLHCASVSVARAGGAKAGEQGGGSSRGGGRRGPASGASVTHRAGGRAPARGAKLAGVSSAWAVKAEPTDADMNNGGGTGADMGSLIDPCEHCHSTLPPLVLDVCASCTDCAQPRPCIQEEGTQACGVGCGTRRAAAVAAPEQHDHHAQHVPGVPLLLPVCAHGHGIVYNVTAMCQACHSNRSLVAA
ncbi:hypothetical protein FOA52_002783 [Chlamydomonas sp. UWO 241]|nr:hypothetical protein FOA52_002783 [Chlamydomonas sp. UWO 241]